MGTMGLPSIPDTGGLCFLPQRLPAFEPAGANKPPETAPSTARKERRLQANFMGSFLSTWRRGPASRQESIPQPCMGSKKQLTRAMDAFKNGAGNPWGGHRRFSRYGTKPRTSILIL